MKFYSKNSNYQVTLRPSIPGNHLLGNPPKPGLHIRFEDGEVNVDDPEMIRLMKLHPAYERGDFFSPENNKDPWAENRQSSEPEHNIEKVEHGVTKNMTPKSSVSLTKEQKKIVNDLVQKGIKESLGEILSKYDLTEKVKKSSTDDEKENIKEDKEDGPKKSKKNSEDNKSKK